MAQAVATRTIRIWFNVEKEFLVRFFTDEIEFLVHYLLATKQKDDKKVKSFVEHL